VEYRLLARSELDLIWKIDRREVIHRMYRLQGGKLKLVPAHFDVQGWPPEDTQKMAPLLPKVFERGGAFFGAFDGDHLVGVAVLDTIWRGPSRDLLQLEMMHVSRDFRAHGVGSRLFEQARRAARERGARGLYISATPSENTIHFYQRHGSVLLETPDPDLLAIEPEDIHLECPA